METNYTRYELHDFVEDPSFIEWVKSNGSRSSFWTKWEREHPNRSNEIQQAKALVLSLAGQAVETQKETENRIWKNITAATNPQQSIETPKVPTKSRRLWLSMAAAAAVALLVFAIQPSGLTKITTGSNGNRLTQTLPDGSSVELNAGTELSYEKEGWDTNRRLNLKGEAFFVVKKGQKFSVETTNGTVEVLGTSFNVFARNNTFKVYCKTGRVKVVSSSGANTILTPGKEITFRDGKELSNITLQRQDEWRNQMYNYTNVPIGDIIEEFERQHPIKIECDEAIKSMPYYGQIKMNDLDSALFNLSWPLRLEVEKKGSKIHLSKQAD